jgi:hypothetical protein
MDERRRAKSQGCQGRGTLRTTATRGCSRVAVLAVASGFVSAGFDVAALDGVDGVKREVDGEEGTEEARW